MTKRRTSAKQRLAVVAEVFDRWNRSTMEDEEFAKLMRQALYEKLDKGEEEAE